MDSYVQLDTDHELVLGSFGVNAKKQYSRHDSRPREWDGRGCSELTTWTRRP